ncbi:hypothetical protein BDN72DRAFT_400762 [Pluteus cervinus]|uniref:Uncharacterized protein n=1 Tax=Pluteus cervinus TaxID=181527 RepID=A0ACD3B213_9AGAR|nr:hypothetical protein BDN72DRAFT_400762 [Pluteus cervinus]
MSLTNSTTPTCEDIAIILSLREGSSRFIKRKWAHEGERDDDLAKLLDRFSNRPEGIATLDEFGSKYLPAVVDRFIEAKFELPLPPTPPPGAFHNGYFSILSRLSHPPLNYFAKYLRSKHPIASPGKKLGRVIAERLAEITQLHPDMTLAPSYAQSLFRILDVLAFILLIFEGDQEPITVDVKMTLLVLVEDCKVSQNERLRTVSASLSNLLTTSFKHSPERRKWVMTTRGQNRCGLPTCNITTGLKACARCLTVCYCSPEHQRAHWRSKISLPHKACCFSTVY